MDYLDSLSLEELKGQKINEEYEEVIDYLVRPLGGLGLEDIVMKTIKTELGLKRAMNEYSLDHRIVVDVKYGNNSARSVHSLGVIPLDKENVSLLSTHVPDKLKGVISIAKLATHLAISESYPSPNHPIATANFIAIPNPY